MISRLAAADYSFPLLPWEQALRFAHDLGMSGIDISLFEGRSHLKPAEMLSHPTASGSFVRRTVQNNGMVVADVFNTPGQKISSICPKSFICKTRRRSRDYFKHLVEFAHACQSAHVSILPGVDFEDEGYSFSFALCAEELAWRSEVAKDAGVQFGVEAHVGSIISQPAQARCLLDAAPKLTLTLDPAHFIAQGFSQNEIDPLIKYTSHVHARCARPVDACRPR